MLLATLALFAGGAEHVHAADAVFVLKSVPPVRGGGAMVERYGIRRDEARLIEERVPGLKQVVSVREVPNQTARFGEESFTTTLVGTTEEFASIEKPSIARGRFLEADDLLDFNTVAVVGARVARSLFKDVDPVGQYVRVGRNYFLVVGVCKENEKDVIIPITTMRTRLGDLDVSRKSGAFELHEYELSRVYVVVDERSSAAARSEIQSVVDPQGKRADASIQLLHESRTP